MQRGQWWPSVLCVEKRQRAGGMSTCCLSALQPVSAHLRQRYELFVDLSPSAFELSLIPKAAQETYPTLTLDSQGGRRPASYWP